MFISDKICLNMLNMIIHIYYYHIRLRYLLLIKLVVFLSLILTFGSRNSNFIYECHMEQLK